MSAPAPIRTAVATSTARPHQRVHPRMARARLLGPWVVLLGVAVVGTTLIGPPSVGAQPAPESPGVPGVPSQGPANVVEGPPLFDGRDPAGRLVAPSPILSTVEVTSEEFDEAATRATDAYEDLVDANGRLASSGERLARLERERNELVSLVERTTRRRDKAAEADALQREALSVVALRRFVDGNLDDSRFAFTETAADQFDRYQRTHMLAEAERLIGLHLASTTPRLESVERALSSWTEQTATNSTELSEVATNRDTAAADSVRSAAELTAAEQDKAAARPLATVTGSDMTFINLDAYWRAARSLEFESPQCRLPWWAIAGVGRTESIHGTIFGGSVLADGTLTAPIFGIALDGTNGTRLIPDTDRGTLDGDAGLDRAVGPLQFIPSTWQRFAADQTGDGRADPQNFYDATLAAARYLCRSGPGLDTPDGLRRAYFSYNRSPEYVELVLSRSLGYGELEVPGPDAPES